MVRKTRVTDRDRPLHEVIEEMILARVRDGQLKPGQKLKLVEEMASKWDVSRATVQQSLQALAAKGLVYRRPRAGTYLTDDLSSLVDKETPSGKRSRIISLLLPAVQFPEFSLLARGVEEAAHEQGLNVIVNSTENNAERYASLIRRHIELEVEGIFMVPPHGSALPVPLLLEIQASGIPVVTCFRSLAALTGWPVIRCNGFHSGRIAAEHLISIGRRRIGFFGLEIETNDHVAKDGHYGLLSTLSADHRKVEYLPPLALAASDFSAAPTANVGSWRRDIDRWLRENSSVDAICCAHDHIAVTAIQVLREHGKSVPRDVAVTGSGNYAGFLGYPEDELTTITTQSVDFGRAFCQMMSEIRTGTLPEEHQIVEIKGHLVIGRSTVDSQTPTPE